MVGASATRDVVVGRDVGRCVEWGFNEVVLCCVPGVVGWGFTFVCMLCLPVMVKREKSSGFPAAT